MSALPRTGASSPTARQTPRQKTRQTPPEARSASQASECSAQSDATLAGSPDALQTPDSTPAPVAAQLAPLAALAQLTDTLPVELLEAPRWIVFHLAWVEVKGKRKLQKTPYNARTGKLARSNDARTWSTYGAPDGRQHHHKDFHARRSSRRPAARRCRYRGSNRSRSQRRPFLGIEEFDTLFQPIACVVARKRAVVGLLLTGDTQAEGVPQLPNVVGRSRRWLLQCRAAFGADRD